MDAVEGVLGDHPTGADGADLEEAVDGAVEEGVPEVDGPPLLRKRWWRRGERGRPRSGGALVSSRSNVAWPQMMVARSIALQVTQEKREEDVDVGRRPAPPAPTRGRRRRRVSCAYVVAAGHATILAVDYLPMVAGLVRRGAAWQNPKDGVVGWLEADKAGGEQEGGRS